MKSENQIHHFTIGTKWRRSLHDVRVRHGADAASGQHLVVAVLKTKLKAYTDRSRRPSIKFNVQCLRGEQKSFKNSNRSEETYTKVLSKKTRKHKKLITSDTLKLIIGRENLKDQINQTQAKDEKHELQE